MGAPVLAQEETEGGATSVRTIFRQDGTRMVTKTDPETRSAEAMTYKGEKLIQRVVYTLNQQNQADKGIVYDGKGNFLYNVVLKLNDAGVVMEEARYDRDGKLLGRIAYGYDSKGELRTANAFDSAGNPVSPKVPAGKRPPRKR